MKKAIFFLIIISLAIPTVIAQDKAINDGIQQDKNYIGSKLNLKDSVRSIRFFYSHITDGMEQRERARAIMRNFIRSSFYIEFDKYGMFDKYILFSKNKDLADDIVDLTRADSYEYDESDRHEKSIYRVKYPQKYHVYIKQKVLLNQYLKMTDFEMKQLFRYVFDSKKNIIEEKFYIVSNNNLNISPEENDLYIKTTNEYDEKDRLIKQRFSPGPYGLEIKNLDLMSVNVGFCEGVHLAYEYDDKDRVISTTLACGDVVKQRDDYSYHPEKNYVQTIKRYLKPVGTSGYYTNNTLLTYNEHEDLIAVKFINNPKEYWDPTPERTTTWDGGPLEMTYDYDYDSHNNWIKCRMYLQENKEEPTIIAERVIEYFDKKN